MFLSQAEKPCVNGDFSFLWESQKFDAPQNEIKFGTVVYFSKGTRIAKFYANPSKSGFSASG